MRKARIALILTACASIVGTVYAVSAANLPSTTTQFVVSARSYLNPQGPTQQTLFNYTSPDSLTCQQGNSMTIVVPTSTSNYEINLPVLFPSCTLPLFIFITDSTNPGVGFNWGLASGGARQTVGPNLFLEWMANGSTALQPIYIDNTSATSELVLTVGVASN